MSVATKHLTYLHCEFYLSQNMRMAKGEVPVTERKPASALSSKLIDAMRERIIPLAMHIDSLPSHTRFMFTQEDVIDALIKDIQRDNPAILADRDSFMLNIQSAYDRFNLVSHG
jgi:hypothetical protein